MTEFKQASATASATTATFTFVNKHQVLARQWTQATNIVKNLVAPGNDVCGGTLDPEFVPLYALPAADAIVLVAQPVPYGRNGRMVRDEYIGFALLQFPNDQPDALFIDVLCAKGAGGLLVEYIKQLAQHLGYSRVILNAISSAINFYRRFGFTNTNLSNCQEPPAVTQSARQVAQLRFSNAEEAEKDPQFIPFLNTLIQYQLTKDASCKNVDQCRDDGYTMAYCILR